MEINKLQQLINTKISEHKVEINGSNSSLLKIQKKLDNLKNNSTISTEEKIKTAHELMSLKDKVVFHKSAIATLTDLLEEINNERR